MTGPLPCFTAQRRCRSLIDHLTVAEHYEDNKQSAAAAREMEQAAVWLEAVAGAMGYTIAKRESAADAVDRLFDKVNAMAVGVTFKKARQVKVGETISGYFTVGDISHGPLNGQIRFRNADNTHTVFFSKDELLKIEVRP